jgi:hypothetical protein
MSKQQTTTRFIPAGASERPHSAGLGIAYIGTTKAGRPWVLGYIGKQSKAVVNYSFGTIAQAEKYIADWFTSLDTTAAMKQEIHEMRKQAHNLQIGTVVYNSWGWEQTNIDFYQVVKVSALYVWLRPIARQLSENLDIGGTSAMSGYVTPCPDQFLANGEMTQHRVKMLASGPFITFQYGSGCVYKGKAVYCSWYG